MIRGLCLAMLACSALGMPQAPIDLAEELELVYMTRIGIVQPVVVGGLIMPGQVEVQLLDGESLHVFHQIISWQ